MIKKLSYNFCLLMVLIVILFAVSTKWNSTKVYAQVQKSLKLNTSELVLDKTNDFQETVEITEPTEFDDKKLEEVTCENFCTYSVVENNKLKFTVKEDYLKTIKFSKKEITKEIKLKYEKSETSLIIKIPPRITRISIISGDKPLPDKERAVQLVDGEKTDIQVKYNQDNTETSTFRLKSTDEKVATISSNSVVSKGSGVAEIIVFASDEENSEIDRFRITIAPAIKTLESKTGTAIFMSENSNDLLKIGLKDLKGQEISDLTRIECKAEEQPLLADNQKLKTYLSIIQNKDSYTLNSKPLDIATPISGRIICSVRDKKSNESDPLPITLVIQPQNGYLTIDNLNGNTLLPYGSLTFLTNVYTNQGIPNLAGITYKLENEPVNKQWVSLSPQGQKLTVNWVDLSSNTSDARPSSVNINVEAITTNGGNYPIRGTITVRMGASVTKFSSLKVKLNVMDSRTASDLYGNVTNDEYYVLMVRLFNDLKDEDPNKNIGQSILAYSSSIEVAVGLEKKYDDDMDSGIEVWKKDKVKTEKEKWRTRNESVVNDSLSKIEKIYQEKLAEFNKLMKEASDKELIALESEIRAKTDRTKEAIDKSKEARRDADAAYKKAMALRDQLRTFYQDNVPPLEQFTYRSDIAINDGKWYPASRDDLIKIARQEAFLSDDDDDSMVSFRDNEPNCIDTITYRPFTFEMIVNTVDRRDERTMRSRIFKILNFVSFGLSTVTAVAVPPKGSDLPLGIEKFGNVAIPGLEELFPNLKEQHRQNIVAQTMKPIEEIPFGSDITRVIFIPKKSIRGLITGHKARISQLCPFYFKVKVAVVTKGGEVTLGGQQTR